jgi:hypothetical protein
MGATGTLKLCKVTSLSLLKQYIQL